MSRTNLTIPEELHMQRLDQALAQLLPEQSRSAIARLVAGQQIMVNGTAASKKSNLVLSGDQIEVSLLDPVNTSIVAQEIALEIVFQDADIAIVNKPAGLVVHPSAGHNDQTLVNALLFHVSDLSGIGGEIRPGIVHRLDKETSGLLVVAKNDAAHRALTAAWSTESVKKIYLAICYGSPREAKGVIDQPIGRDPYDRKRMGVVADGRRALTLYEVLEHPGFVSLIRCSLKTGRTHQIRVHLKHLGHPIVGDPLYSGPQWRGVSDKRVQKALAAMKRQALHASVLSFPHPRTGQVMRFESPLPADMQSLLEAMRST